jgi:hypothetical protein
MATAIKTLTDEPELETEVEEEPDTPEDDGGDAHEPVPDDDEDEIVVGGEAVRGEDEPEGVRNLRNRLKEVEREKRELEARIAPKVDEIGPKPSQDDFWDDPEGYDRAYDAWKAKKDAAERANREQEELAQSVAEEVEAGERAFQTQRAGLRLSGFEAADDAVTQALPPIFINALNLAAGEKAAALRYFLGTRPDELAKLKALDPRKVTDIIKCSALAGAMAKEISVKKRTPQTRPEGEVRGTAGGGGGRPDTKLARLEAEAKRTGVRTALIAYKKERGLL